MCACVCVCVCDGEKEGLGVITHLSHRTQLPVKRIVYLHFQQGEIATRVYDSENENTCSPLYMCMIDKSLAI